MLKRAVLVWTVFGCLTHLWCVWLDTRDHIREIKFQHWRGGGRSRKWSTIFLVNIVEGGSCGKCCFRNVWWVCTHYKLRAHVSNSPLARMFQDWFKRDTFYCLRWSLTAGYCTITRQSINNWKKSVCFTHDLASSDRVIVQEPNNHPTIERKVYLLHTILLRVIGLLLFSNKSNIFIIFNWKLQ
jgi:hypothetical protein